MPDINSELFKQLAGIAMSPVSSARTTSDLDIAKQILLNSTVNPSGNWKFNYAALPTDKGKKQGGPSTFSKVIDILQRPEYALIGWGKDIAKQSQKPFMEMDPLGPIKAGWKGLTGEEKNMPSKDLAKNNLLPENKVGRFAVGLTADILGDPLTYVGPGLVRGIAKGVKELTSADKTAAVINKAVEDAPAVSTALDQTIKTAGVAEHALSPMQAALVTKSAIGDATMVLKGTEASPAAVKTFNTTMKDVLYQSRTHPQNVLLKNSAPISVKMLPKGSKSPTTGRFISRSVNSFPKVVEQTTRALNGVLDEPIRLLKPGETVSEQGVKHGIMSRVATWWGQKDLRPLALDAKTSALAAAEARQSALAALFKPFTDEQLLQAWDVATKIRPKDITDPTVVKLADDLTGSMENWFKSSAIPDAAAKGNSVALRAGLTIDDLNKALARYGVDFRFTNASDAAVKGGTHTKDYSNGVDWLNSWEGHIPETAEKLRRAIFGIQSAAEQVTREYGFLDDAASRFGSTTKQKGWVAVKHDRLDGWYFPPEMGDQLSLALKTYHDMYRPSSDVAKFMAQGVSAWKSGVTKYNPRHHIANIIGDTFLAWLAGVNNPIVFKKAWQVMASQRGLYKDIKGVEDLVAPGAIANAMTKPGKVITKSKNGTKFTADQIHIAAFNYGLLQKVSAIEDIVKPGLGKFKPFGGNVSKAASVASETREHYVKLAHFIDAIGKSKGKTPTEIFEAAAHEVRKWHPDGLDLTKEEQFARTWLIPFYSWMRKSTPLLIEGAVMNPKKAFLIPQHTLYNAQTSIGINPSSPSDLFPADQMFPEWIQESGIGPLGLTGAPGIAGFLGSLGRQGIDKDTGKEIGGYTLAGPSNPMNDFFESYGGLTPKGITRGLAGSLNPMIRIPGEVAFQQRVFSGVPISDKSDYATEQIPGFAQFSRMTNITPFGGSARAENEGFVNKEGILNWLFDAGITGTGPYIKSAEFEDIPRQRDQNNRYREFAKQIGQPLNSKGKIPQWIKDLYAQQEGK